MLPPVFDRRAAQRFAQMLPGARGRRPHPRPPGRHNNDLARLVDITRQLERLTPDATPSPGFRGSLRAQLIATAEREGIGATTVTDTAAAPGRATPRSQRVRLGVTVAAGALIVATVASVSTTGPDNMLYRLRTAATEQAKLRLAISPAVRGERYLQFARARMFEVEAVEGDAPEVATILDRMDFQTHQGVALLAAAAVERHDFPTLHVVDRFQADQSRMMTIALDDLSGGARARALRSQQLINAVAARFAGLHDYLHCAEHQPDALRTDDLGPVPQPCAGTNRVSAPPDGARPGPTPTASHHPAPSTPNGSPGSSASNPTPKDGGGIVGPTPTASLPTPVAPVPVAPVPMPVAPAAAPVTVDGGIAAPVPDATSGLPALDDLE